MIVIKSTGKQEEREQIITMQNDQEFKVPEASSSSTSSSEVTRLPAPRQKENGEVHHIVEIELNALTSLVVLATIVSFVYWIRSK